MYSLIVDDTRDMFLIFEKTKVYPYELNWYNKILTFFNFIPKFNKSVLIARSSSEAINIVNDLGMPDFMYLDHDLGGNDTVLHFLKDLYLMYGYKMPPNYVVHSENPIGTQNIISYLESWRRLLLMEKEYNEYEVRKIIAEKILNYELDFCHEPMDIMRQIIIRTGFFKWKDGTFRSRPED
jgi:hypothetical protein